MLRIRKTVTTKQPKAVKKLGWRVKILNDLNQNDISKVAVTNSVHQMPRGNNLTSPASVFFMQH